MNRHWTPKCIEAARNLARSDGALREELADRLLLAADAIEQLLRQRTQARESAGKVGAEAKRLREVVDLCAIWFEVDDEERKSMGGDDRMREALAAREGRGSEGSDT